MNKKKAAVVGLFVLAMTSGVAGAAKKNISISLHRKEIREMSPFGLTLVFYLQISNSSAFPYYLNHYDYRVVIQDTDYFSLRTSLEPPILIERSGDTLISLPVKITYAFLYETVKGIEGNTKVPCYVTGLLTFSDGKRREEKTAFAFPGEFPIFKGLNIDIQPLELKNLTVGGADFIFSFSCRNQNAFEVVLGNLAYRLTLGGKSIAEGVIPGENTVGAQAEKTYSLPVILDFFEVGKELYGVFDQPSTDCQFSGEAQAASVWGDFKLTFSRDEKIKIMRE